MPIRGDRLRWPPRPGKKSETGTRRTLSTDEAQLMRRPDERDESAHHHAHTPGGVIKRAHDDLKQGQEDTDCRNRAAEAIDLEPQKQARTTLRRDKP